MNIERTSEYHLDKNTDQDSALNFEFLRAHGLELVQKYSGSIWTDYNLHDPGVTLLEYLCYAITDLAYKSSFNIEDILTDKNGKIDYNKNLFYHKKDILTSSPISINDFRKIVIDQISEVHNIWIEPFETVGSKEYIKGLFKVQIQPTYNYFSDNNDEDYSESRNEFQNSIVSKVKAILNDSRNLGCDFVDYSILKPCDVHVEADIVVDRNKLHEEVLAQVYEVIINTLIPNINFYTEQNLLEKGFEIEEIYEGPTLLHGFIIDDELTSKIDIIDPADLSKAILGIDGVKYIRKLIIEINGISVDQKPYYLEAENYPRFVFNANEPTIRLYNDNYEVPLRNTIFLSLLHKKIDSNKRKYIEGYGEVPEDSFGGSHRNIAAYHSFQSLFPPVYRLNIDLIENDRIAKKEQNLDVKANLAKAKQLKGYLMLFEQVFANFLMQLNNVGDILSSSFDPSKVNHTYFTQPLYNIPGVGNILSQFMKPGSNVSITDWDAFKDDSENEYIKALEKYIESDDIYIERKQRLIDHMLSRFNINLLKYPIELYKRLYIPGNENAVFTEVKWKIDILNNLVNVTKFRNKAINYSKPFDKCDSGFEYMMRTLLYINNTIQGNTKEALGLFSNNRFSVKKSELSNNATRKNTYYEVNWDGQRLVMLITQEEIDTLFGAADITLTPNNEEISNSIKNTIIVPNKSFQFLKDGIEYGNYRIGPEINNKGFIVLFRSPKDSFWVRIGKFDTMDMAVKAKNEFINSLIELSIQTEKFYLVEHILLRPPLDNDSYGFEFFDEKGEMIFRNNKWFTFEDRNSIVKQMLSIALSNDPSKESLKELLLRFCTIVKWTALTESFLNRLLNSLLTSQNSEHILFPCFKNIVKKYYNAENEVSEDFFRYRLTVFFPSWPARFQDKAFRQFTETIFGENAPAHMRLNFKWLNFNDFQEFESIYIDWMSNIGEINKGDEFYNNSNRLIKFLS